MNNQGIKAIIEVTAGDVISVRSVGGSSSEKVGETTKGLGIQRLFTDDLIDREILS